MRREPCSVTRCGELFVLRCRDELDGARVPSLLAALARVGRHRAEILVIDLSQLTFLDSAGFQALSQAARGFSAAGVWCGFVESQAPIVREVFTLLDPDAALRHWESVTAALQAADAHVTERTPAPANELLTAG